MAHHYRPLITHRVMVTTLSGRTFSGIAYRAMRDLLVLKDAALVQERGAPTLMDGELVLERSAIDFIQVLGGPWQ